VKITLPGDNLRDGGNVPPVMISAHSAARGQPELLVTSGVIKK